MGQRTFLNPQDFDSAQEVLLPPIVPPSGDLMEGQPLPAKDFASWLAMNLESRLRKNKLWVESHPIAIGSWGRGELSPQSDLDIIFCGDEKTVTELVHDLEKEKLQVRYRYPANRDDWTDGGEIFELNALFWARPFTKEAAIKLQEQKKKIFAQKNTFRKKLLKAFIEERNKRNQRHDSVTNYLEPNLKYGAGGLRDIQQALMIWFWYADKLGSHVETFAMLHHLNEYILTLRQKLHLSGYNDSLVAPAQFELARWFGYGSQAEFMRELQKVLTRISFYCDWVFAVASSKEEIGKKYDLKKPSQVFAGLKDNPSLMLQKNVLHNISPSGFEFHHDFPKVFNIDASDETLRALFRSRLIHAVIPDMALVEGVVQHDQYHRFTVDAHLMQAVRRVHKIFNKPSLLGKLGKLAQASTKSDWQILLWTALYHDLGKAREKDHSLEGVQLVEKHLPRFGFNKSFIQEVSWLVENHLILSTAAFRKDPKSPKVWAELYAKGVHGDRLRRLTLFTAIDINATNPEAWTEWKEKLLWELYSSIEAPQGNQLLELTTRAQKEKIPSQIVEALDIGLVTSVPSAWLIKDIQALLKTEKGTSVQVFHHRKQGTWVRFYQKKDQSGLFFKYVKHLWVTGLQIRHAYVHTISNLGVYDWFQIKSTKTVAQLQKLMELVPSESESSTVASDKNVATIPLKVSLISEAEGEWVFSFRGADAKGILLRAAQILYDIGLQIRWAKVHTWGHQVDDIFAVSPTKDRTASDWTQEIDKRLNPKNH